MHWQQVVQKNKTLRNRKTQMAQTESGKRSKTPGKQGVAGKKDNKQFNFQQSIGFR